MNDRIACANCEFFQPVNKEAGLCRRNAPSSQVGDAMGKFPSVYLLDWCGEFVHGHQVLLTPKQREERFNLDYLSEEAMRQLEVEVNEDASLPSPEVKCPRCGGSGTIAEEG